MVPATHLTPLFGVAQVGRMADWLKDRDALAEQYADAENLNARIALHEEYSTADRDFRTWQFDQFDLPADARVLGVGCGPADFWVENRERVPEHWEVVVTDFSPGMVAEARENLVDASANSATGQFAFETADAADLPFDDDAFDAVTANHMLYHVPDREAAFAEFRRVLKPGGRLYATTNGEENMRVIYDVIESVTGESLDRATAFALEDGREQLEPYFEEVEVRERDDALEVADPDALVAYALSRDDLDASVADDLREAFAARFEGGVLRIEKDVGMFVATAE